MEKPVPQVSQNTADVSGLRGRKKAKRRDEILRCAERLFARDGVDATTMASIAVEADVSPPTVFNYFGSKENILSALIFEGTEHERARHINKPRKTNCSFTSVLRDLFCEITENTMRIAGKRVWRYAEAANIRRVETEFEKKFAYSDAELLNLISTLLNDYDIVLGNGAEPDPQFLATLLNDRWSALYIEYIKDDAMPLEIHKEKIRSDVEAIVALLFDVDFAAHSPLKKPEAAR